ncbi:hypothetical protein [Microbaculum marinum]|uniref:Adhesin domain-containing protein n=1 Tax=Microbaculum marinum TaxID=1764581 RepID=A0AAW9RS05_9HYPH
MSIAARSVLMLGVATALAAFGWSEARALDGYWHGAVSNQWHQGVKGSSSNWFTAPPPGGSPQDVPDGMAVFPPGAERTTVIVRGKRSIDSILFSPGTDGYTLKVAPGGRLTVSGDGLSNQAAMIPQIRADGVRTTLEFINEAVACHDSSLQVLLSTQDRGSILFTDDATGTDKCALGANEKGSIEFQKRASAGGMDVGLGGKGSVLKFTGLSTAGASTIVNSAGQVRINSRGPAKDGKITGGNIVNSDVLNLGNTSVDLSGHLVLQGTSKFNTRIAAGVISAISSKQQMYVDGKLQVFGTKNVAPGTYTVLSSKKGVAGRFAKVVFKKFGNKSVDIKYAPKSVKIEVSG